MIFKNENISNFKTGVFLYSLIYKREIRDER